MKDSLKIAIAGATGYVGIQLIKILSNHPNTNIVYLCGRNFIGKSINSIDQSIKKKNLPKITNVNNIKWENVNILFTALPNGEAQKLSKTIPKNIKIIDLSADFRILKFNDYKKWYGSNHYSKKLMKDSVYAITEFSKKKLKKYRIISCPGCYPTSVQLPLLPLIHNKKISTKNIVIDSKSGYSGAGKKIEKKFNNKDFFKNVTAYGVGAHKHMAEIDQELSKAAKEKINVLFTPHLIPIFRGILTTMYVDTIKANNAKSIFNFLKKYHRKNPFVKIAKFNSQIGTADVINTNFCKISICKDSRVKNKIIIISVIDNLIKGASGQAVQNMNIACKLNETTGLI